MTTLIWKPIHECDLCGQEGYVRENIEDGINSFHSCYYGCGDKRNIPTLENSMCEYCRIEKSVEEVQFKKHTEFLCKRCSIELIEIEREMLAEEEEAEKEVEKYREEDEEVFFLDMPEAYTSHAKYLKSKSKWKKE